MANYYKRIIEDIIEKKLDSSGAILIAGPKFCGKTTTGLKFAKSIYRINTKNAVNITKLDPRIALKGDVPHMIDEWQKVPDTWNYIKEDLDINYEFGKYILTGSSTPVDKTDIQHSGAGRITPLKMYPMSLFESLDSKGLISLSQLFIDKTMNVCDPNKDISYKDICYLICRGGWPLSIKKEKGISLDITKNYYDGLFYFEDNDNESFRNKKPEIFKMILKSYARNISTEASMATIINDVRQGNERTLDEKTFKTYHEALKDLYIVEDLEPWCPNIRSKTAIISTPTRHFVDTSIACQALGINYGDLLNDFNTFGLFFEDFVIRDLRVYASNINGEVRHYRDNAGLKCDAIIHLPNGDWCAIEIKLGGADLIESGATTLTLLKNKIKEKSNLKEPSFMMIITAAGPLYKRKDGILVVPINTLKP